MRITTQTVIELEYYEFDRLVHEHIGRPDYEFLCDECMGAGQVWSSDVRAGDVPDDLPRWAKGEKVYGIGAYQLCAALVEKGVFPEGRVVITTY